jgi:hypothetical protein
LVSPSAENQVFILTVPRLKEVDVTWLYGPMLPNSQKRITSTKDWPALGATKSSLKKRAPSEILLKGHVDETSVTKSDECLPLVRFNDVVEYSSISDWHRRLSMSSHSSDDPDDINPWTDDTDSNDLNPRSMETDDTESRLSEPQDLLLDTED